jgi:hypothetical protein
MAATLKALAKYIPQLYIFLALHCPLGLPFASSSIER